MIPKTAILLLAHGTPNTLGEMTDYLSKVTGGRPMSAEVIAELQHRYAAIGLRDEPGPEPPPLTRWTLAQGSLLEAALSKSVTPMRVYIAMRNWHPFIADVVEQMRACGITRVLAICLAPQNSRTSTGLYRRALMSAAEGLDVTFVDAWPEEPGLIEAFAQRLAEIYPRACAEVAAPGGQVDNAEQTTTIRAPFIAHSAMSGIEPPPVAKGEQGTALPVLFTAHSVPERTVAATAGHTADPYADQARRTAALVFAKAAELLAAKNQPVPQQSLFAFQSQGVAGGPWLGPTVEETLTALASEGRHGVVLQPIGFVCDHVEVLYDIDIAFAETARSLNLRLFRPASLNDSPLLTAALVDLVNRSLRPAPPGPRTSNLVPCT